MQLKRVIEHHMVEFVFRTPIGRRVSIHFLMFVQIRYSSYSIATAQCRRRCVFYCFYLMREGRIVAAVMYKRDVVWNVNENNAMTCKSFSTYVQWNTLQGKKMCGALWTTETPDCWATEVFRDLLQASNWKWVKIYQKQKKKASLELGFYMRTGRYFFADVSQWRNYKWIIHHDI